ncbi:MAG: DsrE family protein [Alkalispirochaeta sp.]
MTTLIILNDPPYGTERSYNGLRLAGTLVKRENEEVKLFLIGDAAACAKKGQTTPNGYYNIEQMMKLVSSRNGEIGVCGSCMDARGMTDQELTGGTHRSSMEELTDWTISADRVITF